MLKVFIFWSFFIVLVSFLFNDEIKSVLHSAGVIDIQPPQEPIVIVGSGLAGMSAAYFAVMTGAEKVIILEKEQKYGGNSAKATSGINGVNTKLQKEKNIQDSYQSFIADTMYSYLDGESTSYKNELVEKLVYNSSAIVDWLASEQVNISLTELSQLGGHSAKRTHRTKSGVIGKVMVDQLKASLAKLDGKIEFRFNAKLEDILFDEKKQEITGIRYSKEKQDYVIHTRAVILACGGYANDHTSNSLLQEFAQKDIFNDVQFIYRPELLNIPTTNGYFASGDCVKIARKSVNALLVDMKEIQLHPTGFIDPNNPNDLTKFLAPEAMRGLGFIIQLIIIKGGLLLNAKGERFVNELDLRSKVVEKIYENKDKFPIYLLLNQQTVDTFGPNFNYYLKVKSIFTECSNLHDMATKLNIVEDTLIKTFEDYEAAKTAGKDEFGKTVFPTSFTTDQKLYLSQITPVIHYTMGGLQINLKAEILNQNKSPIKGLYGAGEVTGGVHGKNRLGGNSLLDCGVFGSQAGISAVQYLKYEKKVENE